MEKVNKGLIKFKLGNHYCWDFICTCLFSIDNFEQYMPIFSKYDAKKNLFIEKYDENSFLVDKEKDVDLKGKNIEGWTSFKVMRTTNKGNLYFSTEKSENIINDENSDSDSEQNIIREVSNLLFKKENYEYYNEIQKLLQ